MIFEIVIVFDPELSFRVHNKLHQPPSRIAYMDLGIVPLAASAFFFWIYPAHFPVFSTFGLSRTKMRGKFTALAFEDRRDLYPPILFFDQPCKPQQSLGDLYGLVRRESNDRFGGILIAAVFNKKIHL